MSNGIVGRVSVTTTATATGFQNVRGIPAGQTLDACGDSMHFPHMVEIDDRIFNLATRGQHIEVFEDVSGGGLHHVHEGDGRNQLDIMRLIVHDLLVLGSLTTHDAVSCSNRQSLRDHLRGDG